MTWRPAPAVKALFNQANILWPGRSKRSDGTIGDAAHRDRKSDHNPDADGWVDAGDLTHDPTNGPDAHAWIRDLVRRGNTERIQYAISNRQITDGVTWRKYTRENPHTAHVHISVWDEHRNDTSPWFTQEVPLPNGQTLTIPAAAGRWFVIPADIGYRVVTSAGNCYDAGPPHIGAPDEDDDPNEAEIEHVVATVTGKGYTAIAADGREFNYGDAIHQGGFKRG